MALEDIFRAYDIRGAVPGQLDPDVMERIGRAFGTHVQDDGHDRVVVGRDVRDSSPALRDALVTGIAATGVDVTDIGLVPYGTVLFHARRNGLPSAYVTASHLPKGNNGVKFADTSGAGYREEENAAVHDLFQAAEFADGDGTVTEQDVLDDYTDYLAARVDMHDIDVLMDPGNGAASVVAPQVFRAAGATVEVINGDPDGTFPNRSSDVTPESLAALRERMRDGDADVRREREVDVDIAYDGDADRVGIVDDTGRLLSAEEAAYIALEELLQEEDDPVVANVECSRLIEDVAEQYGREVVRTRVGHSYLFREVIARGACLGVESSRHMAVSKLLPLDDSIAASLYIAAVVSHLDGPLSEKVDSIPAYQKARIPFDVPHEHKFDVVEQLADTLEDEYEHTNRQDGIRVDLPEGWILIRASNTSPKVRLTVEAETEDDFEQLEERFSRVLEAKIEQVAG